jgi:flagellar hook-length control protein FliK
MPPGTDGVPNTPTEVAPALAGRNQPEATATTTGAVGTAAPVTAALPAAQAQPAVQSHPQPKADHELQQASSDPEKAPDRRHGARPPALSTTAAMPERTGQEQVLPPPKAEAVPGLQPEAEVTIPLPVADVATRTAGEPPVARPAESGADQTGRSVSQQLVAAVRTSGEGGFEIHLSPEELGRVTLSLHVMDDSVVLSIQADRQDTLDLMRRNTDVLLREFRDAGFASLSFSFGQGFADGRPARVLEHPGTLDDRAAIAAAAKPSPAATGRAPSSTRLDLRL